MLLQNLYVPFSINGAFTDLKVHHAMGASTPPYHHNAFEVNTSNNLDGPLEPGGHNVHDFLQ